MFSSICGISISGGRRTDVDGYLLRVDAFQCFVEGVPKIFGIVYKVEGVLHFRVRVEEE
jgi:hypothetical protein